MFTPVTNNDADPYDYKIPAFINQDISPLYFPASRINPNSTEKMADLGDKGIITITETQRVLWWHEPNKGAIEILGYIEKGKYFFGANENGWLYIFVNNQQRNLQKLYKINLNKNETEIIQDIPYCYVDKVIFLPERLRCVSSTNIMKKLEFSFLYGYPIIMHGRKFFVLNTHTGTRHLDGARTGQRVSLYHLNRF